jgi:pimeloyl-ACP methyl ester carboxylesterase
VPTLSRPDGATIYYEVEGTGFPLLLFAPGGINSQVDFFRLVSAINPFEYADEFMVIGMNQRNSSRSPAPLLAPDWSTMAADQRAVLDAVGIDRALLWGGCIGVGYVLRFIMEAPDRVAAAVVQDPVGLAPGYNSRATFWAMFKPTVDLALSKGMSAVVEAAQRDAMFVRNHEAGPFAARIADDAGFRADVLALDPQRYVDIVTAWDEQLWGAEGPFVSVPESFVRTCPTPLLVLPGHDDFHPTATSERICAEAPNARCLDIECRSPAMIDATKATIREFLHAHGR